MKKDLKNIAWDVFFNAEDSMRSSLETVIKLLMISGEKFFLIDAGNWKEELLLRGDTISTVYNEELDEYEERHILALNTGEELESVVVHSLPLDVDVKAIETLEEVMTHCIEIEYKDLSLMTVINVTKLVMNHAEDQDETDCLMVEKAISNNIN